MEYRTRQLVLEAKKTSGLEFTKTSLLMSDVSMSVSRHESCILFPLRTNVALFQSPQGYLALEERLKIASLLYDRLILEGGFYVLQAAATGAMDFHQGRSSITDDEAHQRRQYFEELSRREQPSEFLLTILPNDSINDPVPIIGGRIESLYFAEFQSLAARFSINDQPWVEWLDGEILAGSPPDKWVRNKDYDDEANLDLGDEFGNRFVKSKLIHALNRDLAHAAILEATLSTDPLHLRLMTMKQNVSGLVPSGHSIVVGVGLPAVRDVPWSEIIDLRRDRGMADFRRVVDEIENEVASQPEIDGNDDLRDEIVKKWQRRVADAISALRPSLKQLATESTKGLVLDFVPLPGLSTLLGTVSGVREIYRSRKSWLTVFMRLAR